MKINSSDAFNFISKLTPHKLWNSAKILSSFYISKATGMPVQWGLPFTMSVEPTTACNLGCPECPSGLKQFTRPTGNMDITEFQRWINQAGEHLVYLYFYFQGEPYINPSFLDMVRFAAKRNIYTVTSTNAHFLDDANARKTVEAGLDRLIISIDGATQDVYEAYRRHGKLDKVLEGARNIVKWKRELKSAGPYTIFQFLVVKPNEHQADEVKKMAKEIGVDEVKFKTAQIYDYENGSGLIPENDRYSRYSKQPDGTYKIKNKLLNHCWKLWHSCVITWDGRVIPCCFDKDASYEMGNINSQPLKEIWHNKQYQNFRSRLFKSRKEIDICTNCTEGTKVWV